MNNFSVIIKFTESVNLNFINLFNDSISNLKKVTFRTLNKNEEMLKKLNIGFVKIEPFINTDIFLEPSVQPFFVRNDFEINKKKTLSDFSIFQLPLSKRRTEIIQLFNLDKTKIVRFNTTKNLDKVIKILKKQSYIKHVEINYITKPVKIEPNNTTINKNKQTFNILNFTPKKNDQKTPLMKNNILVAIIDTGVNYKHLYLKENLWCSNTTNNQKYYGINLTPLDNTFWYDVTDYDGHGTHIAGIIGAKSKEFNGIANNAKLLTLRVNNVSDEVLLSKRIEALAIAYILEADVINCSWYIDFNKIEESKKLNKLLNFLEEKKCIPVFAAGNKNIDVKKMYPQNKSSVIVVGSINNNKSKAKSSCHGENITIWATGQKIRSTYINNKDKMAEMSGTSMAAPFVTATIALLKQINSNFSLKDIKSILQLASEKITIKTKQKIYQREHLLNINESLKIANIMAKQNTKKPCKISTSPYVLNTTEDISNHIFTFLKVDNPNIFQLMHIEVDNYDTIFHIYGRYTGNKISSQDFEVSKIELKLINMYPVTERKKQYFIESASLEQNIDNECLVDFTITARYKITTTPLPDVIFPPNGTKLPKNGPFVYCQNQVIDYHINTFSHANGRICKNRVRFD